MKKLLALAALAAGFSMSASANCTVELQGRGGRTLDTFYGQRCRGAMRRCNDELSWRQRQGRNPYAQCLVVGRGGRPGGGRPSNTCTYEMRRNFGNGQMLQAFTSYGFRACSDALRDCQDALSWRQSRGQNPRAACVQAGAYRPGPAPRPPVPPRPPRPIGRVETLECHSWNQTYSSCGLPGKTILEIVSINQVSNNPCYQNSFGSSYGMVGGKVWVNHGCRAVFTVRAVRN